MAKKKYYAVKTGKTPGIYESWAECEANVKGFPGAEYKGFAMLSDAEEYMGVGMHISHTSNTNANACYIGQDEVGRGEPFRRIIVVSSYIDGSYMDELQSIGALNDSKNYGLDTDKCIEIGTALTDFNSFDECKNGVYESKELGVVYSVYSIDNSYYNKLREGADKINSNKILSVMHNRAGYNLCTYLSKKQIRVTDVVIDNFVGTKNAVSNFAKYTSDEKYRLDSSGVKMHYETKAENKYPTVAVAANIANYIEALYVAKIRDSISAKGGDFDAHGFSNSIDDVQYAFDEIVRVYGSLNNPDIEEEFKHTVYYKNYMKTGHVKS